MNKPWNPYKNPGLEPRVGSPYRRPRNAQLGSIRGGSAPGSACELSQAEESAGRTVDLAAAQVLKLANPAQLALRAEDGERRVLVLVLVSVT